MKKIILSAIVFTMAVTVQAQEIPERKTDSPPMMERKRQHKGMEGQKHGMAFQNLNLTEDQKAKFKSQNESFHQQMEELKKNDGITVKEWKAKAETLHKEHKASMESILTSDQKASMEKMKVDAKERHSNMEKQRGENMGKERGDRMKTLLGLSDEQAAKMKSNREETGEKIKSIRSNSSLTDEQKRDQMKELMKKQKENLKSILTEEQVKKLKETQHSRPEGERKKTELKQKTI
jgi:Spy/CpxP family protein refolding chaperone